MPTQPSEPPLPLEMTEEEATRVRSYLYKLKDVDPIDVRERLLIEILDALRGIDDKLAQLVAGRKE